MKVLLKCFLCLIGSRHIRRLLVQSCGQLLKVHRLISHTQKCHGANKSLPLSTPTTHRSHRRRDVRRSQNQPEKLQNYMQFAK